MTKFKSLRRHSNYCTGMIASSNTLPLLGANPLATVPINNNLHQYNSSYNVKKSLHYVSQRESVLPIRNIVIQGLPPVDTNYVYNAPPNFSDRTASIATTIPTTQPDVLAMD
jgi:hypothetical protein